MPAADPAPRRGEAGLGALDEQLPFHRSHRTDDREDQPASRCLRVDAEVQDGQADVALVEVIQEAAQVAGVAAEPGQLYDDQRVAGSQVCQARLPLRPVRAALSGRGLGKDALAPVRAQLVQLPVQRLVRRADSCISNDCHVISLSLVARSADMKKPRNRNRLRGIDIGTDMGL